MPFLSTEKIKIEAATRDILLPAISECSAVNVVKFGEEKIDEQDESKKVQPPRDLSEVPRNTVQ
jgi:hypothetical protein